MIKYLILLILTFTTYPLIAKEAFVENESASVYKFTTRFESNKTLTQGTQVKINKVEGRYYYITEPIKGFIFQEEISRGLRSGNYGNVKLGGAKVYNFQINKKLITNLDSGTKVNVVKSIVNYFEIDQPVKGYILKSELNIDWDEYGSDIVGDKYKGDEVRAFNNRGAKIVKKKKIKKFDPIQVQLILIDEKTGWYKEMVNMDEVYNGQQFFIKVISNREIYLYILNIDSKNKIYKYFPHPAFKQKNPISKIENLILPDDPELLFEFTNDPGIEEIYFFISDKPIDSLESLIKKIGEDGKNIDEKMLNILNSQKNLGTKMNFKIDNSFKNFNDYFGKKIVLIHKSNLNQRIDKDIRKRAKNKLWKK